MEGLEFATELENGKVHNVMDYAAIYISGYAPHNTC